MKKSVILSIILSGLITNLSYSANIIFDLGGVVAKTEKIQAIWQIGPSSLFGLFNPLRIQSTYMDFLNRILPRDPATPLAEDGDGELLPQLMCDWLTGTKTDKECLDTVINGLRKHKHEFDSPRKRKCIKSIAQYMFTPERFAKTISPLKAGKKVLKACHAQKNADGSRKHKTFMFSNFSAKSYELLRLNKDMKRIFDYCDGIAISGHMGLIKPDPAAFEYAFKEFNIDPDKELTIFIDDQYCNIQAACSLGKKQLKCIYCQNQDFNNVIKELKIFGVLPS